MNVPERYTWEAEKEDGEIITSGGDLSGCVRFSLRSTVGLPSHDIIGVKMKNRFGRGFIQGMGGGTREYLHCVVCEGFRLYVRSTDGVILITPEDYELYL